MAPLQAGDDSDLPRPGKELVPNGEPAIVAWTRFLKWKDWHRPEKIYSNSQQTRATRVQLSAQNKPQTQTVHEALYGLPAAGKPYGKER